MRLEGLERRIKRSVKELMFFLFVGVMVLGEFGRSFGS
jgi:hypothetical protein